MQRGRSQVVGFDLVEKLISRELLEAEEIIEEKADKVGKTLSVLATGMLIWISVVLIVMLWKMPIPPSKGYQPGLITLLRSLN